VLDTDRLLPFKVLPDISASFGSIFWAWIITFYTP
jgi:hypothetical protein